MEDRGVLMEINENLDKGWGNWERWDHPGMDLGNFPSMTEATRRDGDEKARESRRRQGKGARPRKNIATGQRHAA